VIEHDEVENSATECGDLRNDDSIFRVQTLAMTHVIQFSRTRWVLAFPLAIFGVMYLTHLTGWNQISYGVLPGSPVWWALGAGVMMIGAAVAIGLRKLDKYAALATALLLTLFTAAVYAPCLGEGDGAMQLSSACNLVKDMVLAAGALAYAGLASARMWVILFMVFG
jgi:hypothetical protein